MALSPYTFTDVLTDEGTSHLLLREGTLLIGIGQYAYLTEEEVKEVRSSGRYVLVEGISPNAEPAGSSEESSQPSNPVFIPYQQKGAPGGVPILGEDGLVGGKGGSPLSASGGKTQIEEVRQRYYVTTPEEFGAKGNEETHDDAEAIAKAIEEAVTKGKATGHNYAEVWLSAKTYFATRALVRNTTTKGSAQIPIPIYPVTDAGFTLKIRGAGSSPIGSFGQTTSERQGSVIRSLLTGQTFSSEFGGPCVLGGPTKEGEGSLSGPSHYSHIRVILDGFTVEVPKNPTIAGVDLRRVLEAEVIDLSCLAHGIPEELKTLPTSELGIALRLPEQSNGNNVQVDSFASEGFYYGFEATNHLAAKRVLVVFAHSGMLVPSNGNFTQGALIDYLSLVACTNGIVSNDTNAAHHYPLVIPHYHSEETTNHFVDSNNVLVGNVAFDEGQNGSAPKVTGAGKLSIVNLNQAFGAVAAPGIPASATPLTNPFWRNAVVQVNGGTVSAIKVDGATTGVIAGTIVVPTGKQITLEYTAAPTWNWTLL